MQKLTSFYLNSAGVLLLAMASALFLINCTNPADAVLPYDPLFQMPLDELFWIIGGITTVAALICFFSERTTVPAFLLLWLASCYLVIRAGLWFEGYHSLAGYLGGFIYAFAIPSSATNTLADALFTYLLAGSCITIWLGRRLPAPVEYEKMSCPACGGHVKFPLHNLGQKIDCPHCRITIALRNSEAQLKTSCFFCHEHIEFPAHALGQKITCPHCRMNITLKEAA